MKLSLLFGALVAMLFAANPVQAGTYVQFRSQFGDIQVELYDEDKPVTVKNFIRYIEAGVYSNMVVHRVISNFIMQGGGLVVSNRTTSPQFNFVVTNFAPIVNEFATGKFYSNKYGTIAMAKTSNPNSATSQFFFNLNDNAFDLDNPANAGGFTVFGRVIGGTDVLDKFNLINPARGIQTYALDVGDIYLNSNLQNCPLPIGAALAYENLIYMDVTMLNVKVAKVGNAAQITWNTVKGKTNFVEFTATFSPPTWQPVANLVGTGSITNVTDNNVGLGRRFYRVRVPN